ncbi:fringe glycosyltransferase [Planococcus citri]|uniref:fringe glycosyltransferase n=1 Tax=Planococcus citri TaxID=170843 RepID=UPI0031F882F9
MLPYMKRSVQATCVIIVIFYMTLLVYYRQRSINDYNQQVPAKWRSSPEEDNYQPVVNNKSEKTPNTIQFYTDITATPVSATTYLEDIFISVKTTKRNHNTRLKYILKTWFQLAKDQTWFFTDVEEKQLQKLTNNHMINTNCSASHNRKALCCKMSVEFDTFLYSNKKWFCHFDDDNYVNVPRLLEMLSNYNPKKDWYLGKPSIRTPLEILDKAYPSLNKIKTNITFWFATGGAGFCLSKSLALKMVSVASGGRFMTIGEKIRLPDDVTMGYIIEYLLGKPLTVIDEFHSHLEPMKFLQQDTYHKQITFSYSNLGKEEENTIKIDGFDVDKDPTRFLSLHCYLFPHFSMCSRSK